MPRNFNRIQRVESLIQQEIARLIETEFKDSELGLITITGAKVSPDLAVAKIFVTVHDKSAIEQSLEFLNQEAKLLRGLLGKRIKLRRTPELHFYRDEAFERGSRIAELLNL
jgi:ribosome-binding factor A